MVFASNIFIFVFLPLFLALYYIAPREWRSAVIVVGSYFFYGWWRADFLLLYIAVTVWSYVMGQRIAAAEDLRRKRILVAVGVIGSLSVLAYFKYFNFLADIVLGLAGIDQSSNDVLWHVILPIGVSFFVFESISYLVDIYRKDAEPAKNFVDFAAFLALYPHLIAGPVMRYKDLSEQITSRTHTGSKFAEGCVWFLIGFCRKVLIADSVAPLTETLFANPEPTFVEAWLGAASYTVQLYFDFAGYSEMAIGLGLMIGFRLIRNFDMPYTSLSITEFWRRWHISLSTWLRDYLYIPLGGNRKGKVRTYVNLFLTMLLGGLWHGANWTFLIWGAWHGVILAAERALAKRRGKGVPVYPRGLGLPITMVFVMLGWVMFRSPNVATAVSFYRGMLGLNGFGISDAMAWRLRDFDLMVLMFGIAIVYLEPLASKRFWVGEVRGFRLSRAAFGTVCIVALSFVAILKLAADSYSPFLYFQF